MTSDGSSDDRAGEVDGAGEATGADLHLDDFTARADRGPAPKYYGEALIELAAERDEIVCLCADLTKPTETDLFRDRFPERFVMAGIAEANMIGVAAGMARTGDVPFAHSFCVFITRRVYDQVAMQLAYPRTNVKLVGFLPGLTTQLGVSHQAIDDVALMRALPNMTVIEPCGPAQMAAAARAAADHDGPVYLRMMRAGAALAPGTELLDLELGRAQVFRPGGDVAILASGLLVEPALAAATELAGRGIDAAVVNVHTIKPLDEDTVCELAATCGAVVTAENHSVIGGLGDAVAHALERGNVRAAMTRVGIDDTFAEGASTAYLFQKYGLGVADVVVAAERAVGLAP